MSTFYGRRKTLALPLSSMGDIAFLLLIFYMATTMVTDQKPRDILIPEQDSQSQNSPYPIVIYLDRELAIQNKVFIFNQTIPIENLSTALQERAVNAPTGGSRFFINIEKDLPYKYLHKIIKSLKQAGVSNLIITTRPKNN